MGTNHWAISGLAILLSLALASCGDQGAAPKAAAIRSIKTFTVSEASREQVRELSGMIEAAESSMLGSEVAGKVLTVNAAAGDRVTEGQVLATLDDKPIRLKLSVAEAELQKSRAGLAEKERRFQSQEKLFKDGYAARSAFDAAMAEKLTAQGAVQAQQAQVQLVRRDLDAAVVKAPFAGVVAERLVDPFQDVAAGQHLLRLDRDGQRAVSVRVPETMVRRISQGFPVKVRAAGRDFTGTVSEVAAHAGVGNSYSVKVLLEGNTADMRPGMSAEVTFAFAEAGKIAMLVPFRAILPGDGPMEGFVFRYDPGSQTVSKVAIRAVDLRDNMVEVTSGLKDGDIVVAAGAAFLAEGQKVTLFKSRSQP